MQIKFERAYIEITDVCNLSCSFCKPPKNRGSYMSTDDFKHVLSELSPFTKTIFLHVKGEPLCHDKLEAILQLCEESGFNVNLTTNGTLLAEKTAMLSSASALKQINISLQALNSVPEDSRIEMLQGIITAAKKLSCAGKIIMLRSWINQEDDLLQIVEQAFGCEIGFSSKIGPGRTLALCKGVFISKDKEFLWPDLSTDELSQRGFCYGTVSQIAVLCDGSVVPCCLDAEGIMAFGNIFEKPITQILLKPAFTEIRNGFREGRVMGELCKRCTYRSRFDNKAKRMASAITHKIPKK